MSGFENGNWHNVNGGGLPYRPPPTVDEALPYSPFTSIVPFSPDVIPFPSTEPPTPPTTLTPDQQSNGRKALEILNNETRGPQSTAQHLQNTLRQLKNLLNPDELTQFNFKPITQLATPPPDAPPHQANGTKPPTLSPFASILLKQTDVSYFPFGVQPAERRESDSVPSARPSSSQPPVRPPKQPSASNSTAQTQHVKSQNSHGVSSSAMKSTQVRPGAAVMIKPLPPSAPREDYQQYEAQISRDLSQKKQHTRSPEVEASVLRPQQREIADRKTEELRFLVASLCEEKDDLEESKNFSKISTPEAELTVLEQKPMDRLSEKISNVANQGRFMALPVDLVLQIQNLLEPAITATTQMVLFSKDDGEIDWSEDLDKAKFGLQASRLVLTTMIEGRDDNRLRREDLVDGIIQLLKQLEYSCIIPVVQSRRSGELVDLFNSAMSQRKEMLVILRLCGIVLSRFAALIGKVNLAERALNTIEYLSLDLLVEQNSDNDKDSVFGIQKFEHFRQNAMDVLAQIFARHEVQRSSIITGILSNLEKLPDKRQSARHFKSAREVPIMTVSALFMRVVQVAAMNNDTQNNKVALNSTEDGLEQEEEVGSDSDSETGQRKPTKKFAKANITADKLAQDLYENANNIAGHVAKSLVERALGVSKTGDKPFRNLLDLFIEDFCNVLGSPEWPSAVLLLSCLLRIMQGLVIGPGAAKQSNINREMALDTMATMGCGIINFKHRVKQLKRALDISQSELSAQLDNLAEDALNDSINDKDLFGFNGPYRMVIESLRDYLELHPGQEDPHLQSVTGCHITIWLHAVLQAFKPADDDQPRDPRAVELQERLESMIVDSKWLHREYQFQKVSVSQSKLASGIITLQSQVCQFLPNLANIMLHYTQDRSSSKLRTKGMDGLVKLLEKDPRILTEQTIKKMANLFSDESPLVRERCLSMVAKVLEQDPSLEQHFLPYVLYCTMDGSVGPKKRAIKLLKDIYRSGTSREDKLKIASSLLLPSQDNEKGIAELTRHTLEEMWLTPGTDHKADDIHNKLSRAEQTTLLVETIGKLQGKATHLEAFEKFFAYALSSNAKNPKSMNSKIIKELVADMIDRVISAESTQAGNTQAHVLHALSIFAKVGPELFTMDQVQLLKLYVKDLSGRDDLPTLRPTVTIFHYVFPSLPALQEAFAEDVRGALSRNVSKLANWAAQGVPTSRETLEEVVRCLWIVSPIVPMGIDRLITMIASILTQLRPLISCSKEVAEQKKNTIISYLILLGTFGKTCDFDQHLKKFQEKVSVMARNAAAKQPANQQILKPLLSGIISAPLVLLDAVRPFSMETWDMNIREQALLSVGQICQQSPRSFMRQDVEKMFQLVFEKEDNARLKRISLTVFREYFNAAERRSDTGAEIAVGEGAKHGAARLDTSFVASDNDSATLHLAKRFLSYLVTVALKNDNELALLATIVITSISRQGLVHPKECGPPLAALGTSPREEIGKPAAAEHKKIHDAHESILEKEYMSAVKMAFDYQRDVFDEPHGMRETKESKYVPKMQRLFEVLKAGSRKTLKKFIENLCKQLDFDLSKLKTSGEMPEAILFARFCLENLGLLEFPRFDELALALNGLESIVLKNTGPAVALAIETEMPKRIVQEQPIQPQMIDPMGNPLPTPVQPSQPVQAPIGEARLRQLTVASIILQMMWETRSFIRRCYNLHKFTGRISPKDYQRPAIRNNFVSGKDLWEHLAPATNALASRETMMKQCYDFAELLEVDKDAQVGEDGEDDRMAGYETPVEDGAEGAPAPNSGGGRNRKRKNSSSLTNTPKKRGKSAGTKKGKRNSKTPELDDESDY